MEKKSSNPKPRRVAFSVDYFEHSQKWLSDPEIKRLTSATDVTREEKEAWFRSLKKRKDYLIWGIELNGQPIGAFGLKNLSKISGEYWGYIGEKEYWGQGIGQWMMQEIFDYARRLKLEMVYLNVSENNERAINLYKKFKFIQAQSADGMIRMERKIN